MESVTLEALVDRLGRFERPVEIGIGRRTAVAERLARTARVTATDIVPRSVPPSVRFRIDDIASPDPGVYAGADLLYALNLPPELHRPAFAVAREQGAALAFTTLGTEAPAIPARPETLPGETLFWACD